MFIGFGVKRAGLAAFLFMRLPCEGSGVLRKLGL